MALSWKAEDKWQGGGTTTEAMQKSPTFNLFNIFVKTVNVGNAVVISENKDSLPETNL